MARLVPAQWVADRLGESAITIVDPRRPMKYLAGHLPGAINIPVHKAFGDDGKLLAPQLLADLIGQSGLGDSSTPVLYDSPEGQNAAMLAWILEYLGRADVHVMDGLFESWKAERREVLYKPVETGPKRLTPAVNPAVRVTLESLRDDLRSPPRRQGRMPKLIDFRSREEFNGERSLGEDVPGHIPGAVNIAWRDLASAPERILKSKAELVRILGDAGVTRDDQMVAYCRSGPRASLGYLALREVGFDVRLFDGSYAEWSRAGLPVEK